MIEDKPEYTKDVPEEFLKQRQRSAVPLHVLINPTIISQSQDNANFFEGCLSVSGFIGVVPRYRSVTVKCLNEKAQSIIINANGWYARILQHEIDHLEGHLCVDRMNITTLMTIDNYVEYWKDQPVVDVCNQLSSTVKRPVLPGA